MNAIPVPSRVVETESVLASGWRLHVKDKVGSTSTVAAQLPAWNAVRAATQNAGRGRTGRSWISDRGGLWLSAVLPCEIDEPVWQFLPLAVGWSLASALTKLGVSSLRVRWPNDLMIGGRKLGGILAERFTRNTAVVGIGINVFNRPEGFDATLAGVTVRLEELVPTIGSLEELTETVLTAVGTAHEALSTFGFPMIAHDLNSRWTDARQVELHLAGPSNLVRGTFAGIEENGALRLVAEDGSEFSYDATQVALLRELN
jgi:BirA family biotin operon repressor/biotin-[acetyl-CoA-carboxylase] ligase